MTDLEIITSIRSGGRNREKCFRWMDKNYKRLLKQIMGKIGIPKEDALDAFHDSLVVLEASIVKKQFERKSKISTYFYTILSNKCKDKALLHRRHRANLVSEYPEIEDASSDFLKAMTVRETNATLNHWLNALHEDSRQVLRLYYMEGLSMGKIAMRMNYSNAQVAANKKCKSLRELRIVARGFSPA